MRRLPSRFRPLDGALADLPLEEPMLLTELDGLLTGVLVSPEPIAPEEWLPIVWGDDVDGVPPFEDPLDVQWFRDAVIARRDEIGRDLARGRLEPILDVDERNGDTLWEPWIDGFAEAMALRPDEWAALAKGGNADAADAVAILSELVAVARGESELDTPAQNALDASAPADLAAAVLRLYAARRSKRRVRPGPFERRAGQGRPQRSLSLRLGEEVQAVLRMTGAASRAG